MNKLMLILFAAAAVLGLLLCPGLLKILPGLLLALVFPATCHVIWSSLPPVRRKEEKKEAEFYENLDFVMLAGKTHKDPSVRNVREFLDKGGVKRLLDIAATNDLLFKITYEQIGDDHAFALFTRQVEDVQKSPEWKLLDAALGWNIQ